MPDDARISLPQYLQDLLEDPRIVLEAIGLFMEGEMRQAWADRSFGGIPWPEQYEGMEDPFIHMAGALTDLKTSPSIKSRRFQRKQPLSDTGLLQDSIKSQVISRDTVEGGVLANIDYAAQHALPGGHSRIPITDVMRHNLLKARRRSVGKKRRAIDKLGFIWSVDEFEQDIAWRPFVGITGRGRKAIPLIVQSIFEGKPIEQVGVL